MPNSLYFNIEFFKRRKAIHINNKLSVGELHEAGEKALDYALALTFFLTERPEPPTIEAESYRAYNLLMRDVIEEFISVAQDNISGLEKRRQLLEKIIRRI